MPPPTYFAILPSNILSFVNPIQVNIFSRVQIYGKTKKDAREIHKISQKRGIIDVKATIPLVLIEFVLTIFAFVLIDVL